MGRQNTSSSNNTPGNLREKNTFLISCSNNVSNYGGSECVCVCIYVGVSVCVQAQRKKINGLATNMLRDEIKC